MKNSFGQNISLSLFGESHGKAIGVVIDGLPAGFEINMDELEADMEKRKAKGKISTARKEADKPKIVSGFFNGKTTGTPLAILIENTNTKSQDYANIQYRLRPGHADFAAFEKYKGYQDYRGGGHFSGRLTAPIVAAGSICKQILKKKGIRIGTHIEFLHHIHDENFDINKLKEQIEFLDSPAFPVLNPKTGQEMTDFIEKTAADKDSVGAILETAVTGMPAGVGEPFFDSVESVLSHLLFSVPAVKGVSFGEGFGFASLYGSQANDPLYYDDSIKTSTNHNAGINGGITNGMPIIIHTVIKPTPSIFKKQHSVDYKTKENVELEISGRHDPCIAHRARAVVDAMIAFGLLDLYLSALATTALEKEILS